mmetsp:Transcript_25544/g.51924  ORF Transcript_25544/g.51924 Transcript_25544/m.51924 type:complete len:99 (+) Transcript_25544:258-554(+)
MSAAIASQLFSRASRETQSAGVSTLDNGSPGLAGGGCRCMYRSESVVADICFVDSFTLKARDGRDQREEIGKNFEWFINDGGNRKANARLRATGRAYT